MHRETDVSAGVTGTFKPRNFDRAAFSVFKMTKFIFLSVSEAIISPVRMIQTMLHEEKDRRMARRIFRYSILKGLLLSAVLCVILLVFGRPLYSSMVSGVVLDETMSLMTWSVVIFGDDHMIMRVKDCSRERNPFVKYEYSTEDDEMANLGIRIVKSFATDIKYSFIYGVNFITITV